MKGLRLFILFILLLVYQAKAQTDNSRFSAKLMQWLNSPLAKTEVNKGVIYSGINNAPCLSTLIKVNDDVDETAIRNLGAYIGTKAGNIWTVRIPTQQMQNFIQLKGIDYIEMDQPLAKQMDSARYATRVDSVQRGINLPAAYSGKDVVIGIIDEGFDYTNPAFYDTTGNVLRIKRVWDQTVNGTPPAGYSYGNEYTDTATMLLKGTDQTIDVHATHVGGIAAGSGYGSANNRLYRGVAYESDLVFVTNPTNVAEWRSMTIGSVIDGMNYIFTYAQSQGKPAVINLSQGSQLGPHDGTSLFSQACDNLCGPGKLLVVSAGNDAKSNLHLQKDFSITDTIVKTFLTCPFISRDSVQKNNMEIWGDTLNPFCFQLGLYHDSTEVSSTQLYCPDNSVHNVYIVGSANDTCFVYITTKTSQYNRKRYADIEVHSKSKDTLCLTVKGTAGEINVWQEFLDSTWVSYTGSFIKKGISWATAGDNKYSIGEVAATRSAITVGGYVTRRLWDNLSGLHYYNMANIDGALAVFSSHGPTIDGRMKPDISAPASMIASSLNSFDPDFITGGVDYFLCVNKYLWPRNNRNYYYGVLEGTSMSSPMVTGIIALMLQVDPALNPDKAKGILYETAIKDNATTTTPDSSKWGAGKINAYAAMKKTIQNVGVINMPLNKSSFELYPNPGNGSFMLQYEAKEQGFLYIEITNASGQVISSEPWQVTTGKNQLPIQMKQAKKGVYFVTLSGRGSRMARRMLVL